MIFLALTLPGLIVAYWLFVRPFLAALPKFKAFYAEADGFWAKVWAVFGRSATMVFSAGVQALGWALQWIDPIGAALGDPDIRNQLTSSLQSNPKVLGYVLMAISALTIAARLRSFAKSV